MLKFRVDNVDYVVTWRHRVAVKWYSKDGTLSRLGVGTTCVLRRSDDVTFYRQYSSILHPKDKNYCRATGRRVSFARCIHNNPNLMIEGWKMFWAKFPRK